MCCSVLVLLSIYNGERFIRQQLDSIFNQVGVKLHLLVRDDGSNDSSCEILREYSEKYLNMEYYEGDNIGFIRSFSDLVNVAFKKEDSFDYYAFADQDDVWFPNKLLTASDLLSKEDNNFPNLFTSNSVKVDSEGNKIGMFHEKTPCYVKYNRLVYNTEQGCTMVFNRKALELYSHNNPEISYHDRWLQLICLLGGKSIYCQSPLLMYRIHSGNTLGKVINRSNENILKRFFSDSMFKPLNNNNDIAREFLQRFYGVISEKDRKVLSTYISYKFDIVSKFKFLFSNNYLCPYRDVKTIIYYFVCKVFNKV